MAGKTLPVGFILCLATLSDCDVRDGLVPSGFFKTFSENNLRTIYCCIFFKIMTKKIYNFSGSQKFYFDFRENMRWNP